MKINFWKPITSTEGAKATIHKSGKLGFSRSAQEKMQINDNTYFKIGTSENSRDENLYLVKAQREDENSIKASKAGDYYYLNTRVLFDELNIDYKRKKIIYDIIEVDYENIVVYKLIKREIERKKSK